MLHGFSRLLALSTLVLACKADRPASAESSTGGSSTGSTGGASSSTGDAVTTTTGATDGATNSTHGSGSTGSGSSGSTSGVGTTSEATGGVGTTVFPEPGPCPSENMLCAPPAGDTDDGTSTGGGDPCILVWSELAANGDAMCDGAFQPQGQGYDANNQCCFWFTCTAPKPTPKACLPLASVEACELGGVDFWSLIEDECRTFVGYESLPFVEGDNCCVEFGCYCGETG
jgi:hypothetical protein